MSNRKESYEPDDAQHLRRLAEANPEEALEQIDDILTLLLFSNTDDRRLISEAILHLSADVPKQIRPHKDKFLTRLDDEDPGVRTNILLALNNLSHWYPQDLAPGTSLMVESLTAENQEERLAAATVLSQIGYYRPDIITSRSEAYNLLYEMKTDGVFDQDIGDMYADKKQIEQGLVGLEGGDLSSRPLEADLAPPGNRARLSGPARVGIITLFWPVFLFLSVISFLWWAIKFMIRYRHASPSYRLSRMLGYMGRIGFLTNFNRAKLYLRRSWIPTPSNLPLIPSSAPTKSDPSTESPPYPDHWRTLSTLVKERDGYMCRNCGASVREDQNVELHADHQVPRSVNGPDFPSNLRTLCRYCHEARHGRKFD